VQDPAQNNWGSSLAPGSYPELLQTFDHEVCMIVRTHGTREVMAYYGTETDLKPARSQRV
jgi:hypothetical protein